MKNKYRTLAILMLGLSVASLAQATDWSSQDYDLYPGDFDGDGKTDILYIAKDASKLSGIAISNGSLPNVTLQSWQGDYLGISWSANQYTALVADFNGDGKADVLLQKTTAGDHYLLLANGDGKLIAITQTIANSALGITWSADQHKLIAGDVNNDGKADLFMQSTSPSGLNAVVLAGSSGTFTSAPTQSWSDGYLGLNWSTQGANVLFGDFNGDHLADLLVQARPKFVMIDYDVPFPVPTYPPNMNGVAYSQGGVSPYVLAGVQTWSRMANGVDWSPLTNSLLVGDFNGDGRADVFFQAKYSSATSYVLNGNAGGAAFAAAPTAITSTNVPLSADSNRLVVGNFDGGTAVGLYIQAPTTAGTNYVANTVGASISASVHAPSAPTSVVLAAGVGHTLGMGDASANDGSASYTIPLATPKGTARLAPNLSLAYSSSAGNGLLGVGWNITGLSTISRCNKTVSQDGQANSPQLDGSDRYCLDGAQLRRESTNVYRTERESFSRITANGTAGDGPASFTVEGRDGLYLDYGARSDSRIEAQGSSSVRVWALTTIRDRRQNRVEFNYAEDVANGSYHIANIQYVSNPAQSLPAAYSVNFYYETRPDPVVSYSAGGVVRETQRLNYIDITFSGSIVHRYDVSYQLSPTTNRSRITSVMECGRGAVACFPATSIQYANGGVGWNNPTDATGGGTNWLPADINGDGIADSLSSGGGKLFYSIGTPSGLYQGPYDAGVPNWMLATESGVDDLSSVTLIDVNSDGKLDVMSGSYLASTGEHYVYAFTSVGAPLALIMKPAEPLGDRVLDFDGDGRTDLASANLGGNTITWYRNTGSGFAPGQVVYTAPPNVTFGEFWGDTWQFNPKYIDFNHDGRSDIIIEEKYPYWGGGSIGVVALQSTGTGFTQVALWPTPGGWTNEMAPTDVNGDGCTDIVQTNIQDYYSGGGHNTNLIISNCGRSGQSTFEAPVAVSPAVGSTRTNVNYDFDDDGRKDLLRLDYIGNYQYAMSAYVSVGDGYASTGTFVGNVTLGWDVRFADLDGNGSTELITYRHLGATKPDLVTNVTDGFGNGVTFNYTTLARGSYSKYSDAQFPYQDYAGPQWIVSSLSATDGIGGTYNRTFYYYGAQQEVQGRGFTGFYSRYENDSRVGFNQYKYFLRDWPYTGLQSAEKIYQPSGTLLSSVNVNYLKHDYGAGTETRAFPYQAGVTSDEYEYGGAVNGQFIKRTVTTNSVDSVSGMVYDTTTTATAQPGSNGIADGHSVTQRTYISSLGNDVANWCLGRPQTVQQINSHTLTGGTQLTKTTTTTWDFANCRPTQMVEQPGDALALTTAVGYDSFGNVNSLTKTGLGIGTRTIISNWGSNGIAPISITEAYGTPQALTTQKAWDYALSVQTSESDPNGLTTSWMYDSFGRRARETRPDGTFTSYTFVGCDSSTNYCSTGKSFGRYRVDQNYYANNGSRITTATSYFDAVDRKYLQLDLNLNGSSYDAVYEFRDSLGRVFQRYNPYAYNGATNGLTQYAYDAVGRVTSQQLLTAAGTLHSQSITTYSGLTSKVTDPQGKGKTTITDVAGKVVRSVDHSGYYQQFAYDAFGNAVQVTDSSGATLQTAGYNIRGMRTSSSDADLGAWVYGFNALGEMTSHTDAKLQLTTDTLDALGRLTQRTEPSPAGGNIVKQFTYGTSAAAKNLGKVTLAQISGSGITTYSQSNAFDSLGRPTHTDYFDGAIYHAVDQAYNSSGLVESITYPTSTSGYRHQVVYEYSAGQPYKVRDSGNTVTYWQANAKDPRGQVMDETLGNGLRTTRSFDATTGLPAYIRTGPGGGSTVQNLNYTFDLMGNLTSRNDAIQNLTEAFAYDNLYRLTSSTLNGVSNFSATYNANGNIATRSDVGSFTYHATKLHAVTSAGGATYQYDANGNLTTKNGAAVSWYASNMPRSISGAGNINSLFEYTPEGAYWKQTATFSNNSTETTRYIGGLLEIVQVGASTTYYRHYIKANGRTVAIYSRDSGGNNSTAYPLTDHLGSAEAVTTATGTLSVRESFAAFGSRRGSNWQGTPSATDLTAIASASRRGYTDHTMLDNLGLVHMNGRVYDPVIGRFMSADPNIDGVMDTQGWNRYAYVKNNPLSFTDPSGFGEAQNQNEDDQGGRKEARARSLVEIKDNNGKTVLVSKADYEKVMAARAEGKSVNFDMKSFGGTGSYSGSLGSLINTTIGLFPGAQLANSAASAWQQGNYTTSVVLYGGAILEAGLSVFPVTAIESVAMNAARAITAESSMLGRASEAAFRAAGRADGFALGAKHAAGAGGGWAKFAEGINPNAALRDALSSPAARILPNDANSFRVVTDLGYAVGSKGETGVRAVVDFEGHVVTWFPVRP